MKPSRSMIAFVALALVAAGLPRPASGVPGDTDWDGDVDLEDAGVVFGCLDGAACPAGPLSVDFSTDGLIDLDDYAVFYDCFSGPDQPIPLTCPPFLTVTAGGPASLEDGQSGQLTATPANDVGPVTFSWQVVIGSAFFEDANAQNPIIWITDSADVTVRVTAFDAGAQRPGANYATDELTITVVPDSILEFFVSVGDDRSLAQGAPTVIDLDGAYYDPAGCQAHQYFWEWTLVSAPNGANGWFNNRYRLGTPLYPVRYTLINEIPGYYVFSLYGRSDCSGAEDTDTVVVAVGNVTPPQLTAMLLCPGSVGETETVQITTGVSGAIGSLSYAWTATNGTIDPAGNPVSFTSANMTDSVIDVTVTDDNGTPGFGGDDRVVTDTCTITKHTSPVTCDVGSDAFFIDDLAAGPPEWFDFTTWFYSYGEDPGNSQNTLPVPLTGNANDTEGPNGNLRLTWSVKTLPAGMEVADVTVFSSVGPPPQDLDFIIWPDASASINWLRADGTLSAPQSNVVAPGTYTFTLSVQRQDQSASASCDLNVTIDDAFTVVRADGLRTINGAAPATGSLTHITTSPSPGRTISMVARSSLAGTVSWLLEDTSLANDSVLPQSVATLGIPGGPDTVASPVTLDSIRAGTFNLNAGFDDGAAGGAADVPADPANPSAIVVHFQPSLLGKTLDSRDLAPDTNVNIGAGDLEHYGRVSSTVAPTNGETEYTFHGAHAGTPDFDGPRIRGCDYDCDGFTDLLILDEDNDTIRVCGSIADDPAVTSPIDNSRNNDGFIDGDFQQFVVSLQGAGVTTDFACADVNSDGFPDLIVGQGLYDEGTTADSLEGRVLVYYHGGQGACSFGVSPWPAGSVPNATFTRADSGDAALDFLFGWRLATGDFDGDTIDDLVVAAPGDNGNDAVEAGRVYVVPGSAVQYSGPSVISDDPNNLGITGAVVMGPFTGAAAGDLFGASLDCAEVNSDGLWDVVIGAPGFTGTGAATPADAGAVFVVLGTGGDTNINTNEFDELYEGNAAGLGLGRQVAWCDYNGNGTADIAASAYNATAGAFDPIAEDVQGRLYVLLDFPVGFDSDAPDLDANFPQVSGDNANSNLGGVLAAADFDGDGFDDLLTSARASGPLPVLDDQKVFVFSGEASPALAMTPTLTIEDGDDANWLDYVRSSPLPSGGTVWSSGTALTGLGTSFMTDLTVGDQVRPESRPGQVRTIVAIATDFGATLDAPFVPDIPFPSPSTLHVVEPYTMDGTDQDWLRGQVNWCGFADFNGDGADDLGFSESGFTDDVSVIYGVDND